jgi:hypothetical protein
MKMVLVITALLLGTASFASTHQPSGSCIKRIKANALLIQHVAKEDGKSYSSQVTDSDGFVSMHQRDLAKDADLAGEMARNVRHSRLLDENESEVANQICKLKTITSSGISDAIESLEQ